MRTSKEEIQEKAMELFLKQGYHGTSTTDICDALGISRPTLYWYFEDKEALLFSLHKDSIERDLLPILDKVGKIQEPLERLRVFVREHAAIICGVPETRLLIHETGYLSPEHVSWVQENWKEQLALVRGAIRELQSQGRAKAVPDGFAAFSLIGMITWAYNWFDFSRPEGLQAFADTVEEIFFSGLLKPGEAAPSR